MNENENMVQDEGLEAEDLLSEDLSVDEPQDESISLEEALTDEGQTADTGTPEAEPQSGKKEPGYVQQRISKAVQKAVAEARAQWQAEFDSQMAPLREYQMEMEAQKLVSEGKVKDLETAKELVRYRQGRPQPQADSQPEQQSEATDRATQARISMLQHQADRIKANNGPDVIAEFKNNPEVKSKIVSGEWDFEDVAEMMRSRGGRKPPSPMRSPNGANSSSYTFDFANMSSEQFAKLEKRIQEGARISLK